MREQQIIALAEDILDQFGQHKREVDVDRIAEGLGVAVVRGPLGESTSGVIYREGRHTKIGINNAQSPVRQRFTLAHELGHFHIHKDQALWVDSHAMFRSNSSVGDPREVEANHFAAELLMPRRLLKDVQVPQDERKADMLIRKLAKEFNVSVPAMSFRLLNLQLIEMF